MLTPRVFRNPPITEAVIEFKVKVSPEFSPAQFQECRRKLGDEYTETIEIFEFNGQPATKLGETLSNTSRRIIGYGFKSQDKLNIMQFRRDGFAHNRLKPYTSWSKVFAEALRGWDVYRSIALPELITRVGARYVNHVTVPHGDDVADYFVGIPKLPEDALADPNGFLVRFVANDQRTDLKANITLALQAALDQKSVDVFLDIDVYSQRQYEPETAMARVEADFERIREFKNRIFFSYITERAAKLFE
jgi:uncharacterized protein (TIGR04255 family)